MTEPGRARLEPASAWRRLGERRLVSGFSLQRIALGSEGSNPLVLIHGFPTCSHDWSAVLPILARSRRVLALDLLGFGLSEKPWPHGYSIGEQADLLEAWLAREGVPGAHVLAHDMGDTVVQEMLARRLAGRAGVAIRSVVLLNGGILVEKIRPILAQRILRSPLGNLAVRFLGRGTFGRSLRGIASRENPPAEADLDAQFELMTESRGLRVYPGLIRYMDEREEKRDRWRHATLAHGIPMRLVWGDRDPISPFSMAEEVLRERPATDVVRLAGAGHYPQIEEPERVAELVLEWCSRNDG